MRSVTRPWRWCDAPWCARVVTRPSGSTCGQPRTPTTTHRRGGICHRHHRHWRQRTPRGMPAWSHQHGASVAPRRAGGKHTVSSGVYPPALCCWGCTCRCDWRSDRRRRHRSHRHPRQQRCWSWRQCIPHSAIRLLPPARAYWLREANLVQCCKVPGTVNARQPGAHGRIVYRLSCRV